MQETIRYQVMQQNNKGFLLVELLLALFMLLASISGIAVYQAHTYALCCDTKKRHEAINITNAIIETIHATRHIGSSTVMSDVTVTVKPVSVSMYLPGSQSLPMSDELIFLEIETSWRLTSGAHTLFHTATCMHVGAL